MHRFELIWTRGCLAEFELIVWISFLYQEIIQSWSTYFMLVMTTNCHYNPGMRGKDWKQLFKNTFSERNCYSLLHTSLTFSTLEIFYVELRTRSPKNRQDLLLYLLSVIRGTQRLNKNKILNAWTIHSSPLRFSTLKQHWQKEFLIDNIGNDKKFILFRVTRICIDKCKVPSLTKPKI